MKFFSSVLKPATMFTAVLICVLAVAWSRAQDSTGVDAELSTWDVFVKHDSDESGSTELIFYDLLTGESTIVSNNGERFTLAANGVIYFERGERRVKFAAPDGRVADHDLMTFPPDAYRIDWIVADDRQSIAWTVTRKDQENRLLTSTMVTESGGSDVREVLRDGPWMNSRVLPVAFGADGDELYMDAHPDGISELLPFATHANLFGLNLADGAVRLLPVEPGCFCSTAIADDLLLQLIQSPEIDGVQVKLDDVNGGASRIISPIQFDGFTSAGGLLPSPDGSLAVYVLSQARPIADANAIPQSVLVLADLEAMEQSTVGEPIDGLAYPLSWSEDNAAVLFTDESQSGTWKLELSSGSISEVAEALYLGRLEV